MLISKILSEMNPNIDFEIINEQEFDTFSLITSNVNFTQCAFCDNERYIKNVPKSIKMLMTTREIAGKISVDSFGLCILDEPRITFFEAHNFMAENEKYRRKSFKTKIDVNSKISSLSSVSLTNVIIGKNVVVEEFATIRENTIIGDNTIIRAGAVIGSEGFEFKRADRFILGVNHLGGVVIGNNVEIQYNAVIDKAVYPWDNTIIGDYTKIGSLAFVAHGVKIDQNVLVVTLSGIGGRTIIENNVWIGFGAVISNGIIVGEKSKVSIGAVATKDVETYSSVSGNFAIDHTKFITNLKKSAR